VDFESVLSALDGASERDDRLQGAGTLVVGVDEIFVAYLVYGAVRPLYIHDRQPAYRAQIRFQAVREAKGAFGVSGVNDQQDHVGFGGSHVSNNVCFGRQRCEPKVF